MGEGTRAGRAERVPSVAPAVVHEALGGAGAGLPAEVLALSRVELGFDASRVRVHSDAVAAASARVMRAEAYTVGRHLVFAAGKYAPATRAGRELLRHELQHAAEQEDAAVPGVGGLVVASEAVDERTAEAAERGGFTRARRRLAVRLQRKAGAQPEQVASEGLFAEIREAAQVDNGGRALQALRRLPAGAGLTLSRRDPGLRARLARALYREPDDRLAALALLAGAQLDAWHVRVAAGLLRSRRDGAEALLRATGSTADARALERDFDRDLGDVLPRPTLVGALRGVSRTGFSFVRSDGLIAAYDVPALRAWMRLDHEATDVEQSGLQLAESGPTALIDELRAVSERGRRLDVLAAFRDLWELQVRQLRGWQRPALYLDQAWCLLGLEDVARQFPRGPREQVAGFFASLHAREAARAELADFDRQVQADGRERTLQRVAEGLQTRLGAARLAANISGSDAPVEGALAAIVARLGAWRVEDLRALERTFGELTGRPLTQALRGLRVHNDDLLALLGLLTTGTRYDPHVRVAQALFRRQPAEAQRVLYGLPDAARPRMHADYLATFSGIYAGDRTDTAYVQAAELLRSARQWEREKTAALLDALLTQAEDLYFHTLPLNSANLGDARTLLEAVRAGGRARFRALYDDWNTRVRGPRRWQGGPLSPLELRPAMQQVLSGDALAASEILFVEYADALTGAAPTEAVKVGDLEAALRVLDMAVFAGKPGPIKREVTHLGALVKQLRASDRAGKYAGAIAAAERRLRLYLDTQVSVRNLARSTRDDALVLYGNDGTRSDADEVYRQWQLRPLVGTNEDAASAILAVVTRRWLAGTLDALVAEAKTPTRDADTGAVLREAFDLKTLKVGHYALNGRENSTYFRVQLMIDNSRTVATMAFRLHLELTAPSSTPAERIGGALAFLGLLSAADLPKVIASYNAEFSVGGVGPPAERFIDHLIDTFELMKEVPQIADLVRGTAGSAGELLARARLAEAGRHTAVLSGVGLWLAATFSRRDVRPAIDQALHNLEAIARDERQQPAVLAASAARAGRKDGVELASVQYEDLKSYLAVEQQLLAEAVTWVQFAIEVGVRAALVAVLGPAGMTGLLIGLATVGGGRVAGKLLLGANNQLVSAANIADLATELSGGFYEILKLEDSVGRFVNKVVQGTYKRQILTSALTKVGTASIDGILERLIRQTGGPDFDKQVGVTAGAFAEALGKFLGDKVTFNVGTFTGFNERWIKQTAKQFLAGPPPKASTLASGLAEVVKYARDYQLKGKDEVDLEDVKKRAGSWLLNNFLTGSLVGGSFAINKSRDANKRIREIEKNPAVFAELLGEHPLARELLRSLPPDQRGAGALALARDRELGRRVIAAPADPNASTANLGGQTLLREIDKIAKLAADRPAGPITDKERRKASGIDEAVAYRLALKETRARALARELERASVDPGLRLRPRGAVIQRATEALLQRRRVDEQ